MKPESIRARIRMQKYWRSPEGMRRRLEMAGSGKKPTGMGRCPDCGRWIGHKGHGDCPAR